MSYHGNDLTLVMGMEIVVMLTWPWCPWCLWGILGLMEEMEWCTAEMFSPPLWRRGEQAEEAPWITLASVLSSTETCLVLDSHQSLAGRPPAAFHQPLCAPQLHCWFHLYSPSTIICRASHGEFPNAVALRLGTRSSALLHQVDSITPSLLQLPLT